jgi:hypothetical protein
MAEDSDARAKFLAQISARRASVQAHLKATRPRVRRRANVTIVLTSLAALATAGPAAGGQSFVDGVQQSLGLTTDTYVWRVLCLVAMLVSISAAVLTNLGKSQDAAAQLSTAEAVDGELEGLAVLLEFGQLPLQDAVKLYQQYTAKINFIDDLPAPAAPDDGHGDGPAPTVVGAGGGDGARRARGLPAVPRPARRTTGRPPPPPR